MAKLYVTAVAEDSVANPGNATNSYIILSVEDSNGAGLGGLTAANFKLGSEIVGPGGSTSTIIAVNNGKLVGTYFLKLIPLAGQTWKSGYYIWSVAVTSGANHGQCLCTCLMD
jgi:hypothetical protein